MYNFDIPIERTGTHTEKYDSLSKRFGHEDIIPLWVADMDFAVATPILNALEQRSAHPIFGYSFPSEQFYEALFGWYQRRHQWRIDPADVLLTPGVVPTLSATVEALTAPGDTVLVPTPVYPPFFSVVKNHGRHLVESPMLKGAQGYELDFDHLEQAAASARLLMLCNPHNPVGRVWRKEELQRLVTLALRHDLVVVSDDIHCDLVFTGHTYVPLATLAPPELRLITAISASKTFNIPGLNLSAVVTSHAADKKALQRAFRRSAVSPYNPLTLAAVEAAYRDGDTWLEALLKYLEGNSQWLVEAFSSIEGIHCSAPEATCLLWLDGRELGLTDDQLHQFFVQQAKLGLNEGTTFGPGGSGHMRLNFGTRRALLEQAVMQLQEALRG
ncbi:MAG TPA: PatB family C-S lyase [Alcanivoracaceae bacterium]|nr:PatB family C-S lyase [Alcanivoracaceae bacterium]